MVASPLAVGYYNFSVWGPITLAAMVLLVVVAWNTGQTVSRRALLAAGAITALLCLSAASLLWAQSKENAWTDTNRLILYVVVFAIGVLSIRDRRTARAILVLLGLAALITAVWFPLRFVARRRRLCVPPAPSELADRLHQRHRRAVGDGDLGVARVRRDRAAA